ncbi:efflux RND transporter periplasmic adaptor subunit [Oceanispirochaeta sp.]|jgi:membrane fusion protein (multidrug efflux system)|uniref:efflux RND transporter periplasmic adaptor subunit n=1 Tax=Oceanispirochaeta sp. TaxID=2035350 RepID=UPI0026179198|nr:efflux RND transporter periplasmic adaptor subunit [Oceanispirochaeta sp.]MDA3957672.1 efflux RND transporter periplasmic adaptor subunit [Oceanispirochaeta sp.]
MSEMGKNKKMSENKLTGFILIILITIVLGVLAYSILGGTPVAATGKGGPAGMKGPDKGAQNESLVYTVRSENVSMSTLKNYLKINGDVIAENSVDIYPDAAGKLTKLEISLGSYIRKGQIIAEVDPSLPGQIYIASPVRSTISGTITDLPYKVGATISSTSVPVATVGDLTDLLLVSYIPEKKMAEIALGQKAEIQFEPYGQEIFMGTVSEISPLLDRSSRTLEIRISLDKIDKRIKSGMFGSVRLFTKIRSGVLTISNDSITSSAAGTFVYVIKGDNTVEQRFFETGLTVDSVTEIVSGLTDGEQVVTRGQSMLQNGSSVKVAE